MDDELLARIRRIHAAIGSTQEKDLSKFKTAADQPGLMLFAADFCGGMADEELANVVQSAVYNVAHFKDHLHRWAKANQKDVAAIETAVSVSRDLQIMLDLANADKHGSSPRDGGYSKLNPRITNIDRSLRLHTQPVAGSFVSLTFAADGRAVIGGDGSGSGSVLITGSVVDGSGNTLGDFRDIVIAAVAAWERVLELVGISKV